MGGRGGSGNRNTTNSQQLTLEQIKAKREPMTFDSTLFNKLPKKLQDDKIVALDRYKDSDGVNYNAVIQWEDGFERSIHEYGWGDFKYYLELVLKQNRTIEL